MITDLNRYGKFYGGNSLVISGQNECIEPRLYPNNAYYRFNKLRDEGDWPANITGIYYGKGDCINCPKSNLKDFADYSWKDGDPRLEGSNSQQTLQNNRITDINQFLMSTSKVGTADIRYKFLGPAFQRLIVGYQVFWPMQAYQNPTEKFSPDYVFNSSFPGSVGTADSAQCANRPGVGEWTKEYDGTTVQPWGAMKRKIMGGFGSPSLSQILKTNMGAWTWPERNNSFQWYINSNFNGPPKISGFNGLNKKFSELRIVFDSCSVSNIENRVRVSCPSPGSHIFAGKNSLASFYPDLNYRFHFDDNDNQGLVGCFVEYFALIFTDKEKDTLNPVQLGIVEAKSGYNFYDVTNESSFNDLLQKYGLSIQGGFEISGEANVEITGFGWPRGVNINLCSTEYFSNQLNEYMGLFDYIGPDANTFAQVNCTEGDSIYNPDNDVFSGINVSSGLVHLWSERQGLWTSGHYLDPPFYNGGFLQLSDARYMGNQGYELGDVKTQRRPGESVTYDPNFFPRNVNEDGASYYAYPNGETGWFCRNTPCPGCPDGYVTESRGYIEGKWIYLDNVEVNFIRNKLVIPTNPLYFVHGYASALLTPFDGEAPGGGFYCGERSYPFLNKINECQLNYIAGNDYVTNPGVEFFLMNSNKEFAHWGMISVAGYLENPSIQGT
jgi:hypothetical protein